MKPVDGGGWRDVYHIHNRPEFFRRLRPVARPLHALSESRRVQRVLPLLRRRPEQGPHHALRSAQASSRALRADPPDYDKKLLARVEKDALTLCRALGYDLNTVEFAVENGIPYAIDFMNPAPDADLHSVGQANFDWIVREVADLAIAQAKVAPKVPKEFRWATFLSGTSAAVPEKKPAAKKSPAKKSAPKKPAKAANPKSPEATAN